MALTTINFVHLIEQYPCLYNHRIAEYSRKDVTDKAWSEVAEITSTSVSDCQLKWKNIRNGFVRSLKPAPIGSCRKQKKLYYLHDELQFVLPFLKAVIQTDESANMPASPLALEDIEIEFTKEDEAHSTETPCPEPISNTFKKTKIRKVTDEVDKAFADLIKKIESKSDSPRKMFLLSLLPDVEKFTEEQMRKFRIKMLLLLEEIQTEAAQ